MPTGDSASGVATCRMVTGLRVHCHVVFRSREGGVLTAISGSLARRVDVIRGWAARAGGHPMDLGESRGAAWPQADHAITVDAPVAYHDGIKAIVQIAGEFSGASWNTPTTCPEWRAADLAGHLRCIVDDYHE